MMNKIRLALIVAVLSVVATGLFPSNLNAQTQLYDWTPPNVFLAAGSSAQFQATGVAALDPIWIAGNTPCTDGLNNFHWTSGSTLNATGMQVHDPRTNLINDEPGTVWIGWDPSFIQGIDYDFGLNGVTSPPGAGAGTICAYVSLDSTVGTREFFAYGQMILNSATGAADGGKVNIIPAGKALPQEVVLYFNTLAPVDSVHAGIHPTINVAPSDILPDDTKFATIRTMDGPPGNQMTRYYLPALGYGGSTCGTVGTAIKDSTGTAFQVADFVLYPGDVDCFTGAGPRNYNLLTIGADPVLVIANVTNSATGHLGDPAFWGTAAVPLDAQINRGVLADVFSGLNEEVGSITGSSTYEPLHVYQRESLSGTYNTFDFNVTCTQERYPPSYVTAAYDCQETLPGAPAPGGINPANCPAPGVNCGNPFIYTDALNNYTRQRIIGTGAMVSAVCNNADAIGYAFWGFGNFSGKQNCIRYIPVDNIDPLYLWPGANPYGWGVLPQCTAYPCPTIPFPKVIDGAYPIWTVFRWIVDPTIYGSEYNNVYAYLQGVVTNSQNDFVPNGGLTVFRSHYTQLAETNGNAQYGSNGVANALLNVPGHAEPELGGDMGGEPLTIMSEINYVNDAIAHGTCTWITITNSSCEQLMLRQ